MIGNAMIATKIITGISKRNAASGTPNPSGATTAVKPKTIRMLKMLLPTALPPAISRWPRTAANDRGRQLGKGGADRDDGESDNQLADAQGGGDRHGPIHQPTSAKKQQRHAGHHEDHLSSKSPESAAGCLLILSELIVAIDFYAAAIPERNATYPTSPDASTTPSNLPISPSSPNSNTNPETPIMIGTSTRTNRRETASGITSAAAPRITRILTILLPTTFPIARPGLPGERRLDAHRQLRGAGAECDDGQADDQGRDAYGRRQLGRASDQQLAAHQKRGKAGDEGKKHQKIHDQPLRPRCISGTPHDDPRRTIGPALATAPRSWVSGS